MHTANASSDATVELPDTIDTVEALEAFLSHPTEALIRDWEKLEGDVMFLGVGGKIGPTIARMAKRAAPQKRIIGVARFSDEEVRQRLENWGIECVRCDLLDRESVAALPDVPNIVYMAGRKFGTTEDEPFTWAMNVHVPGIVAERFKQSRLVAFSTLCVYPFAPVEGPGWTESEPPKPLGEYANSCVGRERIFQYFSQKHQTPGRLIRLNYSIDLRYGILHEIAVKVANDEPVNLTTGHINVIWQGDVNEQILRALCYCTTPSSPLNIGGVKNQPVREIAVTFGKLFAKEPRFNGTEANTAWINSTSQAQALFGPPNVSLANMIRWTADWVERRMPTYGKPTRYAVRNGDF